MKQGMESFGILALRATAGLAMMTHGYAKVFGGGMEKFIAGVGEMGFPAPTAFAWLAALSELVGGFCLAIGLGTRASAFFIGVTMVVAVFVRHAADAFKVKELPILFLAIMVYFVFAGGGKWSLDSLICRAKADR